MEGRPLPGSVQLTDIEEYLAHNVSTPSKSQSLPSLRFDGFLKLCFLDDNPRGGIVHLLYDRAECTECREPGEYGDI